ncbi:ankyrin [Hypoxylon trugodes]|uniref:ankyrin n=1 Tax=Hypoxylon trugodes TaxID=326681 RepID=UPI0021A047DE|nr:ankyrin [Hypoxylon trugodes]KAI1386549.1 ankyrin [Hypoxylon trugodes]
MATLDGLANEVLLTIADALECMATHNSGIDYTDFGNGPVDLHLFLRLDKRTHMYKIQRTFVSLALANKRLNDLFTPLLWRFNREYGDLNELYEESGVTSAVAWATENNRIDILEKAFKYQLPFYPIRSRSNRHEQPIYLASSIGHDAVLSWLLDHGASINLLCEQGGEECTEVSTYYRQYDRYRDGYRDGSEDESRYGREPDIRRIILIPPRSALRHESALSDYFNFSCFTKSPLWAAFQSRHESTAILLLSRGARYTFRGPPQFSGSISSALQVAASLGLKGVVEYMVKTMRVRVDGDRGTIPPLYYAAWRGDNGETIQSLLKLGADHHNPKELPAQEEVIRRLIANGACVDGSLECETPLCSAIEKGTVLAVFNLLRAGADIHKPRKRDNKTPLELLWAERSSVAKIISKACLLVAAGACLDGPYRSEGRTLLEYAIIIGGAKGLEKLLEVATHRNVPDEYLDKSLEDFLSREDLEYFDCAKVLAYHGAISDTARNLFYGWALDFIKGKKRDKGHERFSACLNYLRNDQLEDLFNRALDTGSMERCQILIECRVQPPFERVGPWLHLAARCGSIPHVRRFGRDGIDVNTLDEQSRTPMMVALTAGHTDVAELLFRFGTDPFHPRPNAECRQLPNKFTKIISPFEFAIRNNYLPQIRRWWMEIPPESRPTEQFDIPRVLVRGPWHCDDLTFLRSQPNINISRVNDEELPQWGLEDGALVFDDGTERRCILERTMARISAEGWDEL